jgi:hypothetical protein
MFFNKLLLIIINIIHFLVILFVVGVPFTNISSLLILHFITVPFIMFHWFLNNDTCAITLAEKFVRTQMNGGVSVDDWECFSHRIMSPIYKFTSNNINYSQWTWTMTTFLWFITCYKLYGKIQSGELKREIMHQ